MAKTVYIDCTFTVQSGLNTGIQRVVRNIIARHDLAQESHNIIFQPVVSILGCYYKIPFEEVLQVRPTIAGVGQKGKNAVSKLRDWVGRIFGRGPLITSGLNALEGSLRTAFSFVKLVRLVWMALGKRRDRVFFGPSSVVVLLDVFWTYDVPQAVQRSRRGAEKVVAIIYDLIPIYHSRFVEEVNCRNFSEALPRLFSVVDQFVCISESVAQDLRRYAQEMGLPARQVGAFRLGSDFELKNSDSEVVVPEVSEELQTIFSESKVWLMVGTIEPRKNHSFVLDAFEQIWTEGGEERLVIVGRVGWLCEDVVNRIQRHSELGKRLYFVRSASDSDLMYCYQRAHGLVFASHAEGFGLPLVEAMRMGLRVVCSDIPVFREIGGQYPRYFPLENIRELVVLLKDGAWEVQAERDWPTWDRSVDELVRYF